MRIANVYEHVKQIVSRLTRSRSLTNAKPDECHLTGNAENL